ncbi:Lipocalin-like domain-containing protein [Paraphoma chrysanthemicola]|uniref:Lipocalin-like domain-containing protein n=1 Tax=Paraphoma chrysanthemicola TaxID=798071 RepID=A0A8K0R6D3_9PLEO|nr:Lipocalin-like domain-containing protein [Paraphoma chrysanthemicola]
MFFKSLPVALLTCASLANALPRSKTGTPSNSTEQDIIKALAGTYSLINTTSALNGVPIPDEAYGTAPIGILLYTAAGWMSATITATEPEFRPNVTFPFRPNETDAEWAAVGRHSIGYAGPFRVNTELPANKTNGQLFHGPLYVANVPTLVGQNHRRNYTVVEEGGETYLRIGSERGGGFTGTLWWKKVAGAQ